MLTTHDDFEKNLITLYPNLTAWAMRLCGSIETARDIVQDAMVKALRKKHLFISGEDLNIWMNTVLINTWRDMRRRRRTSTQKAPTIPMPDDDYLPIKSTVFPDPFESLELRQVLEHIARLPIRSQKILKMFAIDEIERKEVACLLNTTPMTIKGELKKARSLLRKIIESHS